MCCCSSPVPSRGHQGSAGHWSSGSGFWFLAPSLKCGSNGNFPGHLYIPKKEWQLFKILTPLYSTQAPQIRPSKWPCLPMTSPTSLPLHWFCVQPNEGCLELRPPSASPRRRPRLVPPVGSCCEIWVLGSPLSGAPSHVQAHRFQAWLLDWCPLWWLTKQNNGVRHQCASPSHQLWQWGLSWGGTGWVRCDVRGRASPNLSAYYPFLCVPLILFPRPHFSLIRLSLATYFEICDRNLQGTNLLCL